MTKKWFQYKEQSAGAKRLLLTWHIYKAFGEFPVRIIAFFVGILTFFYAKSRRIVVEKYFQILYGYTGDKRFKHKIFNSLRLFLNFANSLADKIFLLSGNFSSEKIVFENEVQAKKLIDIIKTKQGAFFISTHLGNIEAMRALFGVEMYEDMPKVNIFLQKNACKIFANFLKSIHNADKTEVFAVEDIDVSTPVSVLDKLKNGEIFFMAGDRVSAQNVNAYYSRMFLGRNAKFPLGTMKFVRMLDCPIFFAICIKASGKYKVFIKEFTFDGEKKDFLENLKNDYVKFLEDYTVKYPHQFYNFYDFWDDNLT